MAAIAKKSDPALWDRVKQQVTDGSKGGNAGEWSARKAQLATQEYKKAGGGYEDAKGRDNHLAAWTREDWGTNSGGSSGDTGERYLPKQARVDLSNAEYRRTTAKKRRDTDAGLQFSKQPADIARKTRKDQNGSSLPSLTRPELLRCATSAGIAGRNRMRKDELVAALRGKR